MKVDLSVVEAPPEIANESALPEVETGGPLPSGTPSESNAESAATVESPETSTDLFRSIVGSKDPAQMRSRIEKAVLRLIEGSGLQSNYNFVFLYDDPDSINRFTTNQIYSAVTSDSHDPSKPVFLLLHSSGGQIEPAYLISKCCKKQSAKLIVAVPRLAKSAATLIALGADEIHMGVISELGPIDPQVGNYPALGLGAAVEMIVKLARSPASADMLAKYLSSKLDLRDLGYLERVSASAVQYAERLLADKKLPDDVTPQKIAKKLVYDYKDHSFVIDIDEAISLLGEDTIKTSTPEYQLANKMHELLSVVTLAYDFRDKKFKVIGSLSRGIYIWDKPEE